MRAVAAGEHLSHRPACHVLWQQASTAAFASVPAPARADGLLPPGRPCSRGPQRCKCEYRWIKEKTPMTAPLKHELQQLLLLKVSVTPIIYSSQDVFIHPLFICICFTTVITIS